MSWTTESLTRLVEVILAGGVGVILRDVVTFIIRRRTEAEPNQVRVAEQGIIERALLNISKSNDELTSDITRIRSANVDLEIRARTREDWWQNRWDAREEKWNAREADMQVEIDTMRQKMLELIQELDDMRERFQRRLAE